MIKFFFSTSALYMVFFGLFILNSSCRENAKAKFLVNKWIVSEVKIEMTLPTQSQEALEPLLMEMRKTSYFRFLPDHTFEIFSMGIKSSGTWELNDDGTELFTIESKTGREEKIILEELSADKLILSGKNQGQAIKMILIPLPPDKK